ncbi:LTA synthase family protein [Endomicrobium proavitum]|uniref:Phosphoglycerol transferase n=1 Tax=Endomicrobium proavitum TaxID=1408281 RepID=A0A0G3WI58_9BACT|nr:alkaline phosphatase family protein [Endomicrobium proavitum]AKL98376.1 phosphoglycerol transferase [Endomicrobium proavitum]
MGNFGIQIIKLLSLNFIFLFAMSAYRLIFFLYYKTGIDLTGFSKDIASAFFMGLRLDLSVLSAVNAPVVLFFVVFFIIGKSSWLKTFFLGLKYYYTVFIGLLLTVFCIDFNFYSYFKDHLNIMVFGFIEDDTMALVKTFYENYNLFLIGLGVAIIFAGIFYLSKLALKQQKTKFALPNIFIRVAISVVLPFVVFIGVRGSFGYHAIGVYTNVSSNEFLNTTAINYVFTLQRAIDNKARQSRNIDYIAATGYENNIRQAFADYLGKNISEIDKKVPEKSLISKTKQNANIENVKPNVIFILMESLGEDLVKYNSETFNVLGELKKHFDQDIVFRNISSEDSVTVYALEALFLNTFLRDNSFNVSQSEYVYNRYPFASALPYKKSGYETFFIYGDNVAWRNCGEFAASSYYDNVISMRGAGSKDFPAGPWGVFDEYLFNSVFETLSKNSGKKFIFALTTTNHPPFLLPDNYKTLPLEIPQELQNRISDIDNAKLSFATYQYSNEMLGRFITRIKNSPYGDNTIIVVTGDHSSLRYRPESLVNTMRVPLYLYIPKKLKPQNINTKVAGSHMDIFATLYNISLSNAQYMSAGTNLLLPKAENNTLMYKNFIVGKNFAVQYDIAGNKATYYKLGARKELILAPEQKEHKQLLKRFLSATAISDYLIKNTGEKMKK